MPQPHHVSQSHRDAKLHRRADAVRTAIPGRGRGAHRAAQRDQGAQSRGGGRSNLGDGARLVVGGRQSGTAGRVFPCLSRCHMAGAGILRADDAAVAPIAARGYLRGQAATGAAARPRDVEGRRDGVLGALRRPRSRDCRTDLVVAERETPGRQHPTPAQSVSQQPSISAETGPTGRCQPRALQPAWKRIDDPIAVALRDDHDCSIGHRVQLFAQDREGDRRDSSSRGGPARRTRGRGLTSAGRRRSARTVVLRSPANAILAA